MIACLRFDFGMHCHSLQGSLSVSHIQVGFQVADCEIATMLVWRIDDSQVRTPPQRMADFFLVYSNSWVRYQRSVYLVPVTT